MSIKIMSLIWERGPAAQSERFVLLALADYANDDGECWPSIAGIATKTCLTTRGVQKVIRRLQDAGWLEIVEGGGRKNCHLFRIKTLNVVHPEHGSPLNVVPEKGERGSINPEHGSPEPSITINEPSKNKDARDVRDILCESASHAAVTSFIAYRRKQKGKALTVTAATRLSKQLDEIFANGGDTDDALGMAEERGWLTVQPDWYFKAKGQTHDRNHHNAGTSQGRQNRPDAALEQIARLAGLGATPGYGGR